MKKESIKLKADDFKYPSKEERKEIQKVYPKLSHFGFEDKNELISILIENMSFDEASRYGNLHQWDTCLLNRFGRIHETYVYTLTSYNRGFFDDYSKCSHNEMVNRFMFEYYVEIFYYYFFSTRDIIAQILRLYYRIDLEENELHLNKTFIKKINDIKVKESVIKFNVATKDASEYRNSFAHRFPPNEMDYRSAITEKEGRISIGIGGGRFILSKEIVDNINSSLKSLSVLMIELKKSIN